MLRTVRKSLAVLGGLGLLLGATGSATATATDTTRGADSGTLARIAGQNATEDGRGGDRALLNAALGDSTLRLNGPDRFATAVEISKLSWDDYADVVYIANGYSPADALAMGPSTHGLGPILFVDTYSVPSVTRVEVDRLQPCFIVVLGGEKAVSDAVGTDLDQYADTARCGF